jgi:hypothetical protein
MPVCKFSIVRYVPDPTRGEQLNVGVVVTCKSPPFFGSRFLRAQQTGRLRSLGSDKDFDFLKDLAAEFRASRVIPERVPLRGLAGPWTLDSLERAATNWANTIQFSEPRAAIHKSPGVLLDDLYKRYVTTLRRRSQVEHGRRWIKGKVSRTLRHAVLQNFPDRDPRQVVQSNAKVSGKFEDHSFDYGLANGRLVHLIQALSFGVQSREALRVEIDATAWAIDDVRRARNKTPITVATAGNGKLLEGTTKMYEALGAVVVRETEFDGWLESLSKELVGVLTPT